MTERSRQSRYVPALGYRWLTPFYDTVVGKTTRERLFKHALIRQAGFRPGHQVLDLASGTGTLAIWAKQNHPAITVIGLDGDPDILALAEQKAKRAKVDIAFKQGFSTDLPYRNEQFDRVVSSLFFHHLDWDSKTRTAMEIYRVLKPGGEIHIADWGRAENSLMRCLFFAIQVLDGFSNTKDNVEGKLVDLFERAGFTEVALRESLSTMFGTMALYSAAKPAVSFRT